MDVSGIHILHRGDPREQGRGPGPQVEGQKQKKRQNPQGEGEEGPAPEPDPVPSAPDLVAPNQGDDEKYGQSRRQVPAIEKAQGPQAYRDDDEGHRVPLQPARTKLLAGPEGLKPEAQGQDNEWQGHDVGMQVPQDKAEAGELGDGLVYTVLRRLDDPGGAPPPHWVAGKEGSTVQRALYALDPCPVPKTIGTQAQGPYRFGHGLQVSYSHHEYRSQEADGYGSPDSGPVDAPMDPHQVRNQAEGPNRCKGKEQRKGEIIRHAAGHAGYLGYAPIYKIAEVVVADGVATQPRVQGRHRVGPDHRVEECEIHRLLCVVDGRVVGPRHRPSGKGRQEYQLHRQDSPTLCVETPQQRPPLASYQPEASRGQKRGDGQDRPAIEGHQARQTYQPDQVAQQHQTQGFSESVSPIGQTREEKEGQRQHQKAQGLDGYPPGYEVQHRGLLMEAPRYTHQTSLNQRKAITQYWERVPIDEVAVQSCPG